jgi:hypothetical protein
MIPAVEAEDFARLTAALVSLGTELDAMAHRVQALAGMQGTEGRAQDACLDTCPHAERYRDALREAVHTLERTRTSFKSKELGALRRSLEALLFEGTR